MTPGGKLHLNGLADRFVDLRPAPHLHHGAYREAESEQSGRHQLVEMEGGELARDPDRRRRFVARDGAPRAPGVGVHAATEIVVERRHRGDGGGVEAVRVGRAGQVGHCHVHHDIAYLNRRNILDCRSTM